MRKLFDKNIQVISDEVARIKGNGFYYNNKELISHNKLHPHETAIYRTSAFQKMFVISILVIVLLLAVVNYKFLLVSIVTLLTFLYFIDLLFNLFLIYKSLSYKGEIKISNNEIDQYSKYQWPKYTVFCPLYKEWEILPQFVESISNFDYPKEKLEVMLLLEEDDKQTIEYAQKMNLPSHFKTVVVPHSFPKTKPKACNFGLLHATGEYSVIYDAEDVPDPKQLKKAVIAFNKSDKNVVCIQAKLNFYNPKHNLLTRLFTSEYTLWFGLVLPGLQAINSPIPLGGTSNHFKTSFLNTLNGWDAFNVTEDCDLGIRIFKKGYKTAVLDSITLEEANSQLKSWIWQRSRWVKGYIQTYLVHMRNPYNIKNEWGNLHILTFQLIVGGKTLSIFINPIMWVITISYFIFRPYIGSFIESLYLKPILYMGLFSVLAGNFLYTFYYMVASLKLGYSYLVKYAFFAPLYWIFISIAGWIAVYKFITNPHQWSKTKHGFHLIKNVN